MDDVGDVGAFVGAVVAGLKQAGAHLGEPPVFQILHTQGFEYHTDTHTHTTKKTWIISSPYSAKCRAVFLLMGLVHKEQPWVRMVSVGEVKHLQTGSM